MTTPNLPGRLGSPDMTLATDPRSDPRMIVAMAPIGLADRTPPQPVTIETPGSDAEVVHATLRDIKGFADSL